MKSATRQRHVQKAGDLIARGLPPGPRKAMAVWLGVCTGWVFSLIVLGGVTRLTRSGLSMTEWKFTGVHPGQADLWLLASMIPEPASRHSPELHDPPAQHHCIHHHI